MVKSDGPDAHQIDTDRLAWSYAIVEAAAVLEERAIGVADQLLARFIDKRLAALT